MLCLSAAGLYPAMKMLDTAEDLKKEITANPYLIIAVHDETLPACEAMDTMINGLEKQLTGRAVVARIADTELDDFTEYLIAEKYHPDNYVISAPVYYYFAQGKLVKEVVGLGQINTPQKFIGKLNYVFYPAPPKKSARNIAKAPAHPTAKNHPDKKGHSKRASWQHADKNPSHAPSKPAHATAKPTHTQAVQPSKAPAASTASEKPTAQSNIKRRSGSLLSWQAST